jgi:hypothetical protein
MKVFRSTRFLLLAFLLCLVPAASFAQISISIGIAPPVMPVYEQPLCPEDGYLWTPGYWAYSDDDGYYWVPGAWVPAPEPGFLWTPPYWGFEGGHYLFHGGYWGTHVGYYGGVNYGFGYMGIGFAGGEWRGGHFAYNTAVVRVNRTVIHNTYVNETIVHNTTIVNNRHVAYAGGPGGIRHEPTPEEKRFSTEKHTPPTAVQERHFSAAAKDPQQRFSANHGKPATVAAVKPLAAPVHTQPSGGNRAAEAGRPESRTAPASPNKAATPTPRTESRPATKPETHAAPTAPSHPAPTPRTESRPAPKPETHAAPAAPSHPAPAPRTESRPAPRPETHTAPAPRPETHAAPAPRSAPRPESHPAKPSNEKPRGRGR